MAQVVELTLHQHGNLGGGDFELVHLEGDIIPVEVPAVIDHLRLHIDHGIVVNGVKLLNQNLFRELEGIVNGTENLGHAAQRIVGLHLVGEDLLLVMVEHLHGALAHALVAGGHLQHLARHDRLPLMVLEVVQLLGHEIVVRSGNLIDDDGSDEGIVEQFLGKMEVDDAHAGHHGGAVVEGKALAQGGFQRLNA